tara:strand:- start:17 stop:316 length:300 start_codon:yes stop_codon:yes gene_type:complete
MKCDRDYVNTADVIEATQRVAEVHPNDDWFLDSTSPIFYDENSTPEVNLDTLNLGPYARQIKKQVCNIESERVDRIATLMERHPGLIKSKLKLFKHDFN